MHAALDVPVITQRERIPQDAIQDIVAQIVTGFKPQRIVLFGSYARGNPRPESDVDVLVVMDTPLRETEQAVQICQRIEYLFGLDLIVRTPEHLAERLALGDSFLREIVVDGKVLYESADARVD
jgi:predicted nucleotidyltransferase